MGSNISFGAQNLPVDLHQATMTLSRGSAKISWLDHPCSVTIAIVSFGITPPEFSDKPTENLSYTEEMNSCI